MSELINRAIQTAELAFLVKGSIETEDLSPELIAYLQQGLAGKGAEYVSDGDFPIPLPAFLADSPIENGRIVFEDLVFIELPTEELEDVGNIPEIEYSDDPLLDNGPLSTRRKERLDADLDDIYGADRTRGFDYTYEMRIPDRVKDDPYGADFTTGATVISDE